MINKPYDSVANMLELFLIGNSVAEIAQSFDIHSSFVEGVIRLSLNKGKLP